MEHPYIELDTAQKEAIYLGYALPLTKSEYEVFKVIFECEAYADANQICMKASDKLSLSPSCIAVHVFSINRKAVRLGGKKIVGYKKKYGYFVKEIV